MRADSADRLAQHARARHEQTLRRAQAALTSMVDNGDAITVSFLASRAGVSRSWIYTQPELRDQIEQLQQPTTRTGAPRRETDNHASEESLRRRLDLAHQRIAQLRTENQELRQSLARAHGQLRAARNTARSANGEREGVRPMTVPDVRLHPRDAAELAELLQFLGDWLATDRNRLDASLARFVGNRGYDLSQLRTDIGRLYSCSAPTTASSSSEASNPSESVRPDRSSPRAQPDPRTCHRHLSTTARSTSSGSCGATGRDNHRHPRPAPTPLPRHQHQRAQLPTQRPRVTRPEHRSRAMIPPPGPTRQVVRRPTHESVRRHRRPRP